nr:hypothetical protein [Tanacetum cinerariifolium]
MASSSNTKSSNISSEGTTSNIKNAINEGMILRPSRSSSRHYHITPSNHSISIIKSLYLYLQIFSCRPP